MSINHRLRPLPGGTARTDDRPGESRASGGRPGQEDRGRDVISGSTTSTAGALGPGGLNTGAPWTEPLHLLRERVLREAAMVIEGRASFEQHVRRSTKPLRKIELDPYEVLRLLGDES